MSAPPGHINGRISAMRDFAEQLRQPDFTAVRAAGTASAQGPSGGMAEGTAFGTAHTEAVTKVEAFTTAVDQGYAAYKGLAVGAAEEYSGQDRDSARQMPTGERTG
ncbi:hypothetical protein [Crossiella cryophila]|uniref:Uncharacterized protein n=1 Tax=Crossiella cryophila TaxID=43355 RepID=A0A7W7FWY1_9PSEU|nr:hypothetical protein [Crossiella cryophila]MBB4682011.1 hypothetical protein [Crossiella cryophila]